MTEKQVRTAAAAVAAGGGGPLTELIHNTNIPPEEVNFLNKGCIYLVCCLVCDSFQ